MIVSAEEPVRLNLANVHPVIYVLVTNKLATYWELAHKYTVWEVIALYDICMTNLYNKQVLLDNKK